MPPRTRSSPWPTASSRATSSMLSSWIRSTRPCRRSPGPLAERILACPPELIVSEALRHGRHRQKDLDLLMTDKPLDAADLKRRLRDAVEKARNVFARMPERLVGMAFVDRRCGCADPRPARVVDQASRRQDRRRHPRGHASGCRNGSEAGQAHERGRCGRAGRPAALPRDLRARSVGPGDRSEARFFEGGPCGHRLGRRCASLPAAR